MDQLVGFLLHPPLSEIAKKLEKMLKYTPTFKVLSAPLCIMHIIYLIHIHSIYCTKVYFTLYSVLYIV